MRPAQEFYFCRLCLSSSGSLLDIFDENSSHEEFVLEAIHDLLRFRMVKESGLPGLICHSCLVQLTKFRNFKSHCIQSKFVFDSMLKLKGEEIFYPSSKYKKKQGMQCQEGGPSLDHTARAASNWRPPIGEGIVGSILEIFWCSECGEKCQSLRELEAHSKRCSGEKKPARDIAEEGEEMVVVSESTSRQSFDPNVCCASCRRVFKTKERLIRHINKHDFKCKAKSTKLTGNAVGTTGNGVKSKLSSISIDQDTTHDQGEIHSKEKRQKPELSTACANVNSFQSHEDMGQGVEKHGLNHKGVRIPIFESKSSPKFKDLGSIPVGQQSPSSQILNLNETSEKTHLLCSVCGLALESQELFMLHLSECSSSSNIKTWDSLEFHVGHNRERLNACGCDAIEDVDFSLSVGEKKAISESCDSKGVLPGASRLSADERNASSPVGNISYLCDCCKKSFMLKPDLRSHIVKCHLSMDPQKCKVCHRMFMNSEELEEHSRLHPSDKKFYCTVCEQCFGSKGVLRKHIVGNHDVKSAFICSVCSNGFAFQVDLGLHHTMAHTESEKRFECTACGRLYIDHWSYKEHVKVCQLKMDSFECNVCGKKLSRKYSLDVHSLIHLKVRQYPCSMCPKVFSQCGQRNHHIRAHHLKIRPYQCGICNRSFATKSFLRYHYNTHSDERPFSCPECPKSYKSKNSLQQHIRCHHAQTQ